MTRGLDDAVGMYDLAVGMYDLGIVGACWLVRLANLG